MEEMTLQFYAYVGFWMMGVVFGAGGGWFALRQARKDIRELRVQLNGVGAKERALENEVREKYTTACIAMMTVANSVEDREVSMHVGEILNDPARGK